MTFEPVKDLPEQKHRSKYRQMLDEIKEIMKKEGCKIVKRSCFSRYEAERITTGLKRQLLPEDQLIVKRIKTDVYVISKR